MNQLPAQAHDQQQGRVAWRTDALVHQADGTEFGTLHRHLGVTALFGETRRNAEQEEKKKPKSPHERNTRMQIPSRARV
ncbi:hypothetical protein ACU7AI_17530 [Pseudomonas aeruginosa]